MHSIVSQGTDQRAALRPIQQHLKERGVKSQVVHIEGNGWMLRVFIPQSRPDHIWVYAWAGTRKEPWTFWCYRELFHDSSNGFAELGRDTRGVDQLVKEIMRLYRIH